MDMEGMDGMEGMEAEFEEAAEPEEDFGTRTIQVL